VLSRVRGTIRRGQEPDRSRYRVSASAVRNHSSVVPPFSSSHSSSAGALLKDLQGEMSTVKVMSDRTN